MAGDVLAPTLLSYFFEILRQHDIAVGPYEINRLRVVFSQRPTLPDRTELKTLLGAALVKDRRQREIFDALFDRFCPEHEVSSHYIEAIRREIASSPEPVVKPPELSIEHEQQPVLQPVQRRGYYQAIAVLCLVLLLGGLLWQLLPDSGQGELQPQPQTSISTSTSTSAANDSLPKKAAWYISAAINKDINLPDRLKPWQQAALGLSAIALAIALIMAYFRSFSVVKTMQRDYRGYGYRSLPEPTPVALIEARERQQVIWRIEHFVSDESTRELDLDRTVEATARAGGFVQTHFEAARYERTVWFWQDRQLNSATARTAVAELTASLQGAKLAVAHGYFTDVPHRVDGPEFANYQPVFEESSGRHVIVAILCDGQGLSRQLGHILHRERVQQLLRSLSHWPRLCFVDCSSTRQSRQLGSLLREYQIDVIALSQLPSWLGEQQGQRRPGLGAKSDEWLWAATLALGGRRVQTQEGHGLREALGLQVNPWLVESCLDSAQNQPEQLINRLLRCQPLVDDEHLHKESIAYQAIHWWRERYKNADRQQFNNPLLPWHGSQAQSRWQLEQALLTLYIEPVAATDELRTIVEQDEQLKKALALRLKGFRTADAISDQHSDREQYIMFTWQWHKLPPKTRYTLRQLGFFDDENVETTTPTITPALGLTAGCLAGIGIAALVLLLISKPPEIVCEDSVWCDPVVAAQTVRLIEPNLGGDYRVTVGGVRDILNQKDSFRQAAADSLLSVNFKWAPETPSINIGSENSMTIWRAGALAQPIRGCGERWPTRSLVVIHAEQTDNDAQQLAWRLLDIGTADQVLIGTDWADHLTEWLGPSSTLNQQTQLLVIAPEDMATTRLVEPLSNLAGPWALVSAESFSASSQFLDIERLTLADNDRSALLGIHPIEEMITLKLPWQLQQSQGQVYVYGGPAREKDAETGIVWVTICPGLYTRGVLENERIEIEEQWDKFYNPSHHTVALSSFQIMATELSWGQQGKLFPDLSKQESDPNLPVNRINWSNAREVCQRAGGDLATEAQWEYAARGGSRTGWSFGDEEDSLGDYAWFRDNSDNRTHPVGEKLPNPLGLFDMHGNVWEWTRDWYKEYPQKQPLIVNPDGADSGQYRVLRGGSFVNSPVVLRSADRSRYYPKHGGQISGFRCVRVPPRS